MKQWLAIVAAVAFLALPAMGSAGEETPIPPEANWSPVPPTPEHLAVSQKRVASIAPEQASDILGPAAQARDEDTQYRMVNSTIHDD
jgi:hypothetical protein